MHPAAFACTTILAIALGIGASAAILSALLDQSRAPARVALSCIGLFAVSAAVLASAGVYGVRATAVRQRNAEIGVRMA